MESEPDIIIVDSQGLDKQIAYEYIDQVLIDREIAQFEQIQI